jgi:hypothetical protein
VPADSYTLCFTQAQAALVFSAAWPERLEWLGEQERRVLNAQQCKLV